jgi:hypothetical protein
VHVFQTLPLASHVEQRAPAADRGPWSWTPGTCIHTRHGDALLYTRARGELGHTARALPGPREPMCVRATSVECPCAWRAPTAPRHAAHSCLRVPSAATAHGTARGRRAEGSRRLRRVSRVLSTCTKTNDHASTHCAGGKGARRTVSAAWLSGARPCARWRVRPRVFEAARTSSHQTCPHTLPTNHAHCHNHKHEPCQRHRTPSPPLARCLRTPRWHDSTPPTGHAHGTAAWAAVAGTAQPVRRKGLNSRPPRPTAEAEQLPRG